MLTRKKKTSLKDGKLEYLLNGEDEGKIERIRKKLKKCLREKKEYLANWQRVQADFINYRRRVEEEKERLKFSAQGELLKELLPLLDSLDRIEKKSDGVKILDDQLRSILRKIGLLEIETEGKDFNPELHEAVSLIKSKSSSGSIVREIQKGYIFNGNVIRPAKVEVSR